MSAIADILRRAADIIEENGWIQGTLVDDETGAVCAIGAIQQACRQIDTPTYWSARNALGQYVDDGVSIWNDDEDRTKEEVLAALREAAAQHDR